MLVPLVIACRGGVSIPEGLRRLGLRRFRDPRALAWIGASIGAYLVFAAVYIAVFGEPEQEDIAEAFGALPVQILLS